MYNKISKENMIRFRDIIMDGFIVKKIKYTFPELNVNISINNSSVTDTINAYEHEIYFYQDDSYEVLDVGGNKDWLSLYIWERLNKDIKDGINISLSSSEDNNFGLGFYQINLEEALEDNQYIFIVRNITTLYKNSSESLIDDFGCEVINFNEDYYLVISKYKKGSIHNLNKRDKIFTDFVDKFIRCAFINESLIVESK